MDINASINDEKSKQPRIKGATARQLLDLMKEERFQASLTAYVEGILVRFLDGSLVDRKKVESEIREQIYAELAADGLIIPPETRREHERDRKTG
jgi:hypothetical protein